MEQITLYYRQGSSDKIYQASIEKQEGGYAVSFAYGRRGATLATGSKTPSPVSHEDARRIFDRLVAEKTAKGYTPGPDGTPYEQTDKAAALTGIQCQLLNAVGDDRIEELLADPAWWLQEKFDGRRLLVRKHGESITGINRLGLAIALPQTLAVAAANYPIDFVIDGEAIGDKLHVFDVLRIGDEVTSELRYGERYLRLMNLLGSFVHPNIELVPTAFLPKHKTEMLAQLRAGNCEGVVFKRTDAHYVAGRPASGGAQLKYKFCETASFIVGKINSKRSVGLLLFEGERIQQAGNVTIPSNHAIPTAGQIVECRYLYAFRESGCIYQPVYLGPRDDIRAEECTTAQLKFRNNPVEEAA